MSSLKDVVICLCDLTGIFGKPWKDAGYKVVQIDPQLSDNGTILEMIKLIGELIRSGRVAFVAGFPPCTNTAVSGARHFESKRKKDPYFQAKASLIAEQCRVIGELSGAPWFFENPVSVFSSIFGKPNYSFHPYEFAGYLEEDDVHPEYPDYIAPRDLYPKKTCLWAGGGFELPDKKIVNIPDGFSTQYYKLGGKSLKTKNIRSATPRGFSLAVFQKYGELK